MPTSHALHLPTPLCLGYAQPPYCCSDSGANKKVGGSTVLFSFMGPVSLLWTFFPGVKHWGLVFQRAIPLQLEDSQTLVLGIRSSFFCLSSSFLLLSLCEPWWVWCSCEFVDWGWGCGGGKGSLILPDTQLPPQSPNPAAQTSCLFTSACSDFTP